MKKNKILFPVIAGCFVLTLLYIAGRHEWFSGRLFEVPGVDGFAVPDESVTQAGSRVAEGSEQAHEEASVNLEELPVDMNEMAMPGDPLESLIQNSELIDSDFIESGPSVVRRHIYRTDSKYPLVRVTEQIVTESNGEIRVLGRHAMVADHALVYVPEEESASFVRSVEDSKQLQIRKRLDTGEHFLVASSHAVELGTVERILSSLKAIGFDAAEPDYLSFASRIPNDPDFSKQWGLNNTGQSSGTADADMDAPEAWDNGVGQRNSVTVAVIDTGVDYGHPDLSGNMWKNASGHYGYDYAADDTDPDDDSGTKSGHGTHVAGILGAVGNNGIGLAGTCWNVRIMAVRVLDAEGNGTTSDIIQGIRYATDNGARVINLSLGTRTPLVGTPKQLYRQELERAGKHGVLVVAAAGNGGTDQIGDNNDNFAIHPASFTLDNIISVAATDRNDKLTRFSNYGPSSVDVAAPGAEIWSTMARNKKKGDYVYLSGTSMATPYVAGAAALALSMQPKLTYLELRQIILESVDVLPTLKGKITTGGRLNLEALLIHPRVADVFPKDLKIDFTAGNGDADVNPNDVFNLEFSVENSLSQLAKGVTARIDILENAGLVELTGPNRLTVGDLPALGSKSVTPGFQLKVKPAVNLPQTVKLRIHTSESDTSRFGSKEYSFDILSIGGVSGKVVRIQSGKGIENATVYYDGTVKGSVKTSSDGSFKVPGLGGSYKLRATAPGLVDLSEITISAPRSNLRIELGAASVSLSPDPLKIMVEPGAVESTEIILKHTGDTKEQIPYECSLSKSSDAGIYVLTSGFGGKVSRIDPETGALSGPALYTLDAGLIGVKLAAFNGDVWVLARDREFLSSLKRIDLSARKETLSIKLSELQGGRIVGFWANKDGVFLVKNSGFDAKIFQVDLVTGSLSQKGQTMAGDISQMIHVPEKGVHYQIVGAEIREIDPATLKVKRRFSLQGIYRNLDMAYLKVEQALLMHRGGFKLSGTEFKFVSVLEKMDPDTGKITHTFSQVPSMFSAASDLDEPEWLSLQVKNGNLPAGTATKLPLKVDTSGLSKGTYQAILSLKSKLLPSVQSVQVTLEVNDHAEVLNWLSARRLGAVDLGKDADGDGYATLAEYVFKGDPAHSDRPEGLPVFLASASGVHIEMTVRSNLPTDALQLECSQDLKNWRPAQLGRDYNIRSTTQDGASYKKMHLDWLGNQGDLFIRAKVKLDPGNPNP